ncbi:ankyrin, partial [Lindgomyces ingoldianus]
GETVLHIAAAELGYRTVRFLLSSGANVRARDNQGREPLNRVPFLFDKKPAVQEIVHLLLERGADANGGRHMESQPLHCAVVRGWTEIVQELVNHGAERNAR